MVAVDISPAAAVHRRARYAPDATALVYEERRITAAELSGTVRRLAGGLAAGGVRRGDRIAYLGLNSATLLEALLAAAHLGAVFTPVNFRLAADEVRYILTDCGVHTVIVEEGHRALAESVLADLPARRLVLVDTDPACPAAGPAPAPWVPLSALLGPDSPGQDPVALHEGDLAMLMYTSGTTGRPKGVMLTHGNIWWNAVNVDSVVDTRPADVNLAVAPLFHIGGLNALTLRALLRGGTVVVRRVFDPARCLRDLAAHRVDSLFAVPAMFAALARTPGFAEADLTALRAVVVAGAPVPPQLIREYARHGVLLQQAWGLTETSPFATYLPAPLTEAKAGSAGAPMPYTEVCLIAPGSGVKVDEPGVRGELCVRGPNVTPGYWNNAAATREAFDEAGWFHTGDIAHRDADGYYYIVDRLKDMIISGGENVYPAEVERVLSEYPGVVEVAVVGVPDPRWGETVLAVVTREPGMAVPDVEQVRQFAARHLARYKLPTRLLVIDELPRNASGKLERRPLMRWVRQQVADAEATG